MSGTGEQAEGPKSKVPGQEGGIENEILKEQKEELEAEAEMR